MALTPKSFEAALQNVVPPDIPQRERLIAVGAKHLDLIVEGNKVMNLTRVLDAYEAAVKHVLDSVLPWRFFAGFRSVMDVGTGAGLPGIPLAVVLPDTEFVLCESVQKKGHFVEETLRELNLPNVKVVIGRAEEVLLKHRVTVLTARAVAPVGRIAQTLQPTLKVGVPALLYKGPVVEGEIGLAESILNRYRLTATILDRYDLPLDMGTRTFVELKKKGS